MKTYEVHININKLKQMIFEHTEKQFFFSIIALISNRLEAYIVVRKIESYTNHLFLDSRSITLVVSLTSGCSFRFAADLKDAPR